MTSADPGSGLRRPRRAAVEDNKPHTIAPPLTTCTDTVYKLTQGFRVTVTQERSSWNRSHRVSLSRGLQFQWEPPVQFGVCSSGRRSEPTAKQMVRLVEVRSGGLGSSRNPRQAITLAITGAPQPRAPMTGLIQFEDAAGLQMDGLGLGSLLTERGRVRRQ